MVLVTDKTPEARILVVDDEPTIVELLSVSLRFQGFEVATASSGAQGLDVARTFRPDAIVLDVMMPGMDGFGLLRRLRADGVDAPVLFLTAKDSLDDKISGLTLGADDYVTKPFSLEEVVTRLRVILRRAGRGVAPEQSPRVKFADIELDDDTREVWKKGELVALSAHRVHTAPILHGQRRDGSQQTADSRPRLELRLRWGGRSCRVLRFLPAAQGGHGGDTADSHIAWGRLRDA